MNISKSADVRNHDHYFGRLCMHIGSGGAWTFLFLAFLGLGALIFLMSTVHSRPIDDEIVETSRRVRGAVVFWTDNGFFRHGGLNFSKPPIVDPHAIVYKSFPPAYIYPLYFLNFLSHQMGGAKFSFQIYIYYNQVMVWISATCLGYLGFRLAKRLCASSLFALSCGITGQMIFQTLPFNLDLYYGFLAEPVILLLFICLLIIDEFDIDTTHRRRNVFLKGVCVFLLVYVDKALSVPGLGAYFLSKYLFRNVTAREIAQLLFAAWMGVLAHLFQLAWVKYQFPDVALQGATFLWRSGLDGATNCVGLLAPQMLGRGITFLRDTGLISGSVIIFVYLFRPQEVLKQSLFFVTAAIGFYVIPGYLLSQWALIHYQIHNSFLAMASILITCFVLIPFLERISGNTGVPVWCMVIIGFCLCMYQLRVFAIAHPLPIPQPSWAEYVEIG